MVTYEKKVSSKHILQFVQSPHSTVFLKKHYCPRMGDTRLEQKNIFHYPHMCVKVSDMISDAHTFNCETNLIFHSSHNGAGTVKIGSISSKNTIGMNIGKGSYFCAHHCKIWRKKCNIYGAPGTRRQPPG